MAPARTADTAASAVLTPASRPVLARRPAPAVAAPETDVVELAVVAQRDHATGVNAIMAQAVVPLGDRLTRRHGFRARRECLSGGAPVQGAVGPMLVVERLELTERVEQVGLVPDQGAIEELMSAGLHPDLSQPLP